MIVNITGDFFLSFRSYTLLLIMLLESSWTRKERMHFYDVKFSVFFKYFSFKWHQSRTHFVSICYLTDLSKILCSKTEVSITIMEKACQAIGTRSRKQKHKWKQIKVYEVNIAPYPNKTTYYSTLSSYIIYSYHAQIVEWNSINCLTTASWGPAWTVA